jgi:hypothetical protein
MTEVPPPGRGLRLSLKTGKVRYLALFVPVFGLFELGAHFYFARRAPTSEAWSAVRPFVASAYKPENVVVVAPYWAEPMARLAFGDELMPLRDVARPDVTRYPEALEVSIMGQRAPELDGWKVLRQERHGKFTLRAVQNPSPPRVTYDFTDHVDPTAASARVEKKIGTIACGFTMNAAVESGGLGGPPVFPAARFACPGEGTHVFVGVTIINDEKNHPRRCIWSHPPGTDAELVTRFRDVPLGHKIRGHVGAEWYFEREGTDPPFNVTVMVGGEEAGRVAHKAGDFWKEFELPLPPAMVERTADVEFRVSAPLGGSHVCFEADSR